jgi:PleD family two-component response regulator
MSTEKNLKIEIDTKTIQTIGVLCELSGLEIPEVIKADFIENVSKRIKDIILSLKNQLEQSNNQLEELKKQNQNLKKQVDDLKKTTDQPKSALTTTETKETQKEEVESTPTTELPSKIQNILIIANLGVIMHQLKILFSKFGCKVTLVKSYPEAISELKLQSYECILYDMNAFTENELMLVEALKKATEICHTSTILAVLVIPLKDKALAKKLKSKGVDIIIEKHESWHMNIMKELKLVS